MIEKGTLNCIKSVNGEEKLVKTVHEGDVFGELALLYNCPRAASVMAADVLWQQRVYGNLCLIILQSKVRTLGTVKLF